MLGARDREGGELARLVARHFLPRRRHGVAEASASLLPGGVVIAGSGTAASGSLAPEAGLLVKVHQWMWVYDKRSSLKWVSGFARARTVFRHECLSAARPPPPEAGFDRPRNHTPPFFPESGEGFWRCGNRGEWGEWGRGSPEEQGPGPGVTPGTPDIVNAAPPSPRRAALTLQCTVFAGAPQRPEAGLCGAAKEFAAGLCGREEGC